jgi:protein-disulfide isomerase
MIFQDNKKKRFFAGFALIFLAIAIIPVTLYYIFSLQLKASNERAALEIQKLQQQLAFNNFIQSGLLSSSTQIAIKNNPRVPVMGLKDAPITIAEFGDFQCPFCHEFFTNALPQIKTNYIDTGKANFSYNVFAFLGNESIKAAEAAKCAEDQGKFWQYHDVLYSNQKSENSGGFAVKNLKTFAQNLKLDQKLFNTCLDSNKYQNEVSSDTQNAAQNYGVNSTPTIFINGYRIEGVKSYQEYATFIDFLLSNTKNN